MYDERKREIVLWGFLCIFGYHPGLFNSCIFDRLHRRFGKDGRHFYRGFRGKIRFFYKFRKRCKFWKYCGIDGGFLRFEDGRVTFFF